MAAPATVFSGNGCPKVSLFGTAGTTVGAVVALAIPVAEAVRVGVPALVSE